LKVLICTLCLVAALAALSPAEETSDSAAPDEPPTRPGPQRSLLEESALEELRVPVTTVVSARPGRRGKFKPVLRENALVVDHVTTIEKDPSGKWWTLRYPPVKAMRLLPSLWLEAIERQHAGQPDARFRLSGEVFVYHRGYYLMLRKALMLLPAEADGALPTPARNDQQSPSRVASTRPATRPRPSAEGGTTADDIARELIQRRPTQRVAPLALPQTPKQAPASVPPPKVTVPPGPGRMIVSRRTRLLPPDASGWFRLAFESDNNLREPPRRVLPSRQLEKMENLSRRGTAPGVRFDVSGEIKTYRGVEYVLLRTVRRERDMGQF